MRRLVAALWGLALATLSTSRSDRRLSKSDHIVRKGTVPVDRKNSTKFIYVHIPKAAGASFMNAAAAFMAKGDTLRGNEEQAAWAPVTCARVGARGKRVIFLRSPVQLAYSQFLYCKFVLKRKDDRFPKGDGNATSSGVDRWAAQFPSNSSWRCYNPFNVQFRFVAGARDARDAGLARSARVASACGASKIRDGKDARRSLGRDFAFVGIVDAFRESLCLFRWTSARDAPPFCECGADAAAFPKTSYVHGHKAYASSASALGNETRAALGALVVEDLLLYLEGLDLFEKRANAARAATNATLVCPDKLHKLWADALRDACAYVPRKAAWIEARYRRRCADGRPLDLPPGAP